MKKNNLKPAQRFSHSFVYQYCIKHKTTFLFVLKIFLIAFIFINVFQTVWQFKTNYLSHNYWQRFPVLKEIYYSSIYVNKHGSWIPDEVTYAFAGGELIKGGNPILVNPEVPPFGKYLIGLSALLFNNENIITLISVISSLFMLFLFGKRIFSSTLIALAAPTALSTEPIFLNQLKYTPLLDIIHLLFLLVCFYFFNKAFINKKNTFLYFLLTVLFLGFIISTKFFGVGVPVVAALYAVLFYRRDVEKGVKLTLVMPLAVIILLFSYIRVLQIGYPFHKFLGIQHWVFWYNQGHVHTLLSVWPLILFNKWYILWSNPPIFDPQWRLTWPLVAVLSLVTCIAYLLKMIPHQKEIEIFIAWLIIYFAFLSIGNASARYFIILFPVMYLVAVFGVYHLAKQILNRLF